MQTWKMLSAQPVSAGICRPDLMDLPGFRWIIAESCGIVCTALCFSGVRNCEDSYISSASHT